MHGLTNLKIYIFCYIYFFVENSAVYETMWKNIVEPDRPQMTIWRMRIACWITKATNTLRTCTTLTRIAFLLQQWLYERASMLPYRYTACRVQYLVQGHRPA